MDDRSPTGPPLRDHSSPPSDKAPTSDALRSGIDRGAGTGKVRFPDPSAAPLGTDDEAAGTPPTPEQRRIAAEHELSPGPHPGQVAPHAAAPSAGRKVGLIVLAVLMVSLVAVLASTGFG